MWTQGSFTIQAHLNPCMLSSLKHFRPSRALRLLYTTSPLQARSILTVNMTQLRPSMNSKRGDISRNSMWTGVFIYFQTTFLDAAMGYPCPTFRPSRTTLPSTSSPNLSYHFKPPFSALRAHPRHGRRVNVPTPRVCVVIHYLTLRRPLLSNSQGSPEPLCSLSDPGVYFQRSSPLHPRVDSLSHWSWRKHRKHPLALRFSIIQILGKHLATY